MNILFYQWNAYNLFDIKTAFEQMGHIVTLLNQPISNPEEDAAYTQMVFDLLSIGNYDFMFSINYFPVLAKACHDSNTLYVCWTCDSPLLAMYHQSVFYSTNVIFTFDYSNYQEFKKMGVSNIYHLPLAVNTARIQQTILSEKSNPLFSNYPISFVGSLYEKNSYDRIENKIPDYLCGYLEGAMNAQLLVSGGNVLENLLNDDICMALEDFVDYRKSEESFASIKMLFATTILGFKTASLQRFQSLSSLSLQAVSQKRGEVHLFTTSHTNDLPFVNIHEPVDYLTEMPLIFNGSQINLNMTIPNIKTGIPLRVWDIMGSGGFLLSNYQPEFDNYFSIGQNMDIFEDSEELLAKTEFYLTHDSIRQKMAQKGWELVQKEHTWLKRFQQFFEILEDYR